MLNGSKALLVKQARLVPAVVSALTLMPFLYLKSNAYPCFCVPFKVQNVPSCMPGCAYLHPDTQILYVMNTQYIVFPSYPDLYVMQCPYIDIYIFI